MPPTLGIKVGIGFVIDAITALLHSQQKLVGAIQIFKVSHYNLPMLKANQILVRSIALAACAASWQHFPPAGKKGPLYLPTDPAAQGRATLPETLGISTKPSSAATPATKATPIEADEMPRTRCQALRLDASTWRPGLLLE
jgi:predicted small lipoprotein YifL